MTVPREYSQASEVFNAFLADVAEEAGLTTRHQTYTCVDGVLRTFRRRLTIAQSIAFAQALPPLVRALYTADWAPGDEVIPFGSRDEMTAEVQALRRHHNIAPGSIIADVATALRRHVDAGAFEAALSALPAEARAFWAPTAGRAGA